MFMHEKSGNCMDLLIKDEKNKKHFCKYCLQCFSSERVLKKHT